MLLCFAHKSKNIEKVDVSTRYYYLGLKIKQNMLSIRYSFG